MKNLFQIAVCLLACSCFQKGGDAGSTATFSETDVRSSWVQLTDQDGKWVIFEPCEATNLKLSWKADTLIIEWGQFASMDVIHRIASERNAFSLEGTDNSSDPPNHTFRVEPVDSVTGLARWWLMDEKEPRLLVKESMKSSYTTIKESCDDFFEKTKEDSIH